MILELEEHEFEQVLAYAFRLTDEPPADVPAFEVDTDRIRGFVDRWLHRTRTRCIRSDDFRADPDTVERAIARVKTEPEYVMEAIDRL